MLPAVCPAQGPDSHLRTMNETPDAAALPVEELLSRIDTGIRSHLEWTQRLLRCSVLLESPGDDFLRLDAHRLCRLGAWLEKDAAILESFDPGIARQLLPTHERMHDAVRSVCRSVLARQPADPSALRAFEENQTRLVELLTLLRELVSVLAVRRDALTGLPLRHGLEHTFQQRLNDALRFRLLLFIAIIDIDHFKSINDSHGHTVGDQALKHAAGILHESLRRSDVLVRYGGEEFLVLMLNADAEGARVTADRLLEAFRATSFRAGGQEIPVRITIGLAAVGASESLASAVDRADRALLRGKQEGRDRVVMAGEPPAGP